MGVNRSSAGFAPGTAVAPQVGMGPLRYDKTPRGHDEIAQGRKNLRGKLRTVLFLVDPTKDIDAIRREMAVIGAPPDAIVQLHAQGYIAPVVDAA